MYFHSRSQWERWDDMEPLGNIPELHPVSKVSISVGDVIIHSTVFWFTYLTVESTPVLPTILFLDWT